MIMARVDDELIQRHFGTWEHPYRTFERTIDEHLRPGATLVDVGCGRNAPVLCKYRGRGFRLIGLDPVASESPTPEVEIYAADICHSGLSDGIADLVMARSVMEHVREPDSAFEEINRILKPNGRFVFLTANRWDYASLAARLVPNALHPLVVKLTEGRQEEDVFPTAYKCNSRRQIRHLAQEGGFELEKFEYLGQYPNYLLFSRWAFLAGTFYEKTIARVRALNGLRGWLLVSLRKLDG